MKKAPLTLKVMLAVLGLIAGSCFASLPALAQSASDSSYNMTATQQRTQPDAQKATAEKTFTGKIVKAGEQFVLAAADNQTVYHLDDQEKAQDFLNKTVKVTGVLDASTGTIHVTVIEEVSAS